MTTFLEKTLKSFIKIAPYRSELTPLNDLNKKMLNAKRSTLWSRFYLKESMENLLKKEFHLSELETQKNSYFNHHLEHRFTLSHNPDLIALWIWQSNFIRAAGIDIEWSHRPHTSRLRDYIAHQQDDSGSFTALENFCLKEASFKCLHNCLDFKIKPKSLNQISISQTHFSFENQGGLLELKPKMIGGRELIIAMAKVL